jgi:hypothetical protein
MKQGAKIEDKAIERLLDKLDVIEENSKGRRTDSWIIRLSGVMITTVCVLVISFMVNISERVTSVEQNKADKTYLLDNFLTINSYSVIERQRAIDLIDFIYFIGKEVSVKEEDLEKARTTAIRQLNTSVLIGVTRGG